MELRVLKYFLAVAREESISRAAEQLHMSQPPLSRQIRELEEELGKQLLVRGSRKVTLTEEGMILRRRAEEILSLAEKTRSEVMLSSEDVRGVISIGCAETEGMRVIARKFRALREDYPQVRIHLHSGNAEDVLSLLEHGQVDFALVLEPSELQKFDFIRLNATNRWGILMRRDDPMAARPVICPQSLRGVPLLISAQQAGSDALSYWLGGDLGQLNIAGEYNLLYNAAMLVEEGVGYAMCLDGIYRESPDSPLTFRPLTPNLTAAPVLVWKKYQVLTKAARKFIQRMEDDL